MNRTAKLQKNPLPPIFLCRVGGIVSGGDFYDCVEVVDCSVLLDSTNPVSVASGFTEKVLATVMLLNNIVEPVRRNVCCPMRVKFDSDCSMCKFLCKENQHAVTEFMEQCHGMR